MADPVSAGIAAAASIVNTTITGIFNTSGEKAKKKQINAQTDQINQQTADMLLQLEQSFGLKQQSLANTTNSTNLNNTLSNVSAVETAKLQAQANSNMITTIALCFGGLLVVGIGGYLLLKKD